MLGIIRSKINLSPIGPDLIVPWGLYTVFSCLLYGYILVPMVLSNVLLLVDPFLSDASQFFIQQIVTLLTWFLIFLALNTKYGHLKKYLCLNVQQPLRYYIWETILLILTSNMLTLLMGLFWNFLQKTIPGIELGGEPSYTHYAGEQLWVLAFFAVMIAPTLEELIFRGFIQSTLHKFFGPLSTILWATAIFALLHGNYLDNTRALSHVFFLGLCFGYWRERTNSLIPGIVAHWLNNGLATLMIFKHF